jgi:hypothetical protein
MLTITDTSIVGTLEVVSYNILLNNMKIVYRWFTQLYILYISFYSLRIKIKHLDSRRDKLTLILFFHLRLPFHIGVFTSGLHLFT